MPVDPDVGHDSAYRGDKLVTQGRQVSCVLFPLGYREPHRGSEPADQRGGQGPGADVALLAAAVEHRDRVDAAGEQ